MAREASDYNGYRAVTIMPQSLSVAEAESRLSEVLRRVGARGDRFIIQNRGRPIVALVPLRDLAMSERLARDGGGVLLDLGEEGRERGEILEDIVRQRRGRRPHGGAGSGASGRE